MGRPAPLVAIALALAVAGAAVAYFLHRPDALPPAVPLAHARSTRQPDSGSSESAAAPTRTLDPVEDPRAAESPDAGASGEPDEFGEPALALDFTPNRAQIDQLRRMDDDARTAFARQLSFGIASDELKDPRLRKFIEARMGRSQTELDHSLACMYAASDKALDEKAREIAIGLRPDDSGKSDGAAAVARAPRTTGEGAHVDVVVREGDSPELDRACAAYEKLRDRRIDTVLAIFDLVRATAR